MQSSNPSALFTIPIVERQKKGNLFDLNLKSNLKVKI